MSRVQLYNEIPKTKQTKVNKQKHTSNECSPNNKTDLPEMFSRINKPTIQTKTNTKSNDNNNNKPNYDVDLAETFLFINKFVTIFYVWGNETENGRYTVPCFSVAHECIY